MFIFHYLERYYIKYVRLIYLTLHWTYLILLKSVAWCNRIFYTGWIKQQKCISHSPGMWIQGQSSWVLDSWGKVSQDFPLPSSQCQLTEPRERRYSFFFLLIYHSWFNTESVYGRRVLYCWALILTQDVTNIGLKLGIFLICLIPFRIYLPMWTNLDDYFSYKIDNHPHLTPAQMWRVNNVFASDVLVSISSYVNLWTKSC